MVAKNEVKIKFRNYNIIITEKFIKVDNIVKKIDCKGLEYDFVYKINKTKINIGSVKDFSTLFLNNFWDSVAIMIIDNVLKTGKLA